MLDGKLFYIIIRHHYVLNVGTRSGKLFTYSALRCRAYMLMNYGVIMCCYCKHVGHVKSVHNYYVCGYMGNSQNTRSENVTDFLIDKNM